ncbi:MAG: preprotein translocase subunit SecE [Anaerolineales bacterium]
MAKAKRDERKGTRKQQNAIQRYIKETIGELRKVTWPTRREATNLTIIVIIVTLSMSALLGVLDFIYTRIFSFLLG